MMTQTIGRKLRQFRQKKGYSQETLADIPRTLAKWSVGRKTSP